MTQVQPGSAASLAGVRVGDRLLDFDGAGVPNAEELSYTMQAKNFGDDVRLGILRAEQRINVTATLRRTP